MSTASTPPRWAEVLLERLLPECIRETVVGDLHEEYIESALPRKGRFGASLWYLRQVASFATWSLKEGSSMGKMLVAVSLFTLACTCWLALMETLLRHPGYPARIGEALLIAIIAATTILVRMLHLGIRGERWLWAGAVVLIGIGAEAFIRNAQAAHFEGFVFIISLVLVLQGLLMLLTLGRARGAGPQTRSI